MAESISSWCQIRVQGGVDLKGIREHFGVTEMFYILIVMMVTELYTFAKTC